MMTLAQAQALLPGSVLVGDGATELLRVEWYKSVREAIRGLNKNAFAGLFYSVPAVLLVTSALALTHVLPFVAVFTVTGLPRLLYVLVLANIVFVYALAGRFMKLPFWCAALHPVGTALSTHDAAGGSLVGAFDGLEPGGACRLRLAAGGVRLIHAGDVFLA